MIGRRRLLSVTAIRHVGSSNPDLERELSRTRNIGIIAHIDAVL